jgi:hypothetical protein
VPWWVVLGRPFRYATKDISKDGQFGDIGATGSGT